MWSYWARLIERRFPGGSSFLTDEKGKMIETWYKVKPAEILANVLEALHAAQGERGIAYRNTGNWEEGFFCEQW